MKVDFNLEGRVAVITGGAGILCSEMARCLAAEGVKVAILDIKEDIINEIVNEIKKDGGEAIGIKTNVLDKESLLKAREEVFADR
jgi:NAD(P)-dependent dehydrogenase (short-subunit alcohol dehydrogenase family)